MSIKMSFQSNTTHMKVLAGTIVLLYVLNVCSSEVQVGYPKRDPIFAVRSRGDGERGSGRSTRFYQGTRYGGKRSYWQPFLSAEADASGSLERGNVPKISRDCIYLSLMGLRCPERLSELSYKSYQPEASSGSVSAGRAGGETTHMLSSSRLWNPSEVLENR